MKSNSITRITVSSSVESSHFKIARNQPYFDSEKSVVERETWRWSLQGKIFPIPLFKYLENNSF